MIQLVNILTSRCGRTNPTSIDDYIKSGGFQGLQKAFQLTPAAIIQEIHDSHLLGRGGAAYPTGKKWEQLSKIKKFPKYIVCNADEGEPGTFKDKLLLEKDPLAVIEGMLIAGYTFQAHEAYLYLRGEYLALAPTIKQACYECSRQKFLGNHILGSNFSFTIHLMSGAGAYVCGENSALLNSIEGKAGRPRMKPPHLAEVGLFNQPTLVNNVESFAAIPYIIANGGAAYHRIGTEYSGGSKLICLSGNIQQQGTFEIPFGVTLQEIIAELGQGPPPGHTIKMLHLGGQSGPCMPPSLLNTPYCYQTLKAKGLSVGSGAIVVIDNTQCIIDYLKQVTQFFIDESCGKCTPCREGNRQIYQILDRLSLGLANANDLSQLTGLCRTLSDTSFCGLGQSATKALSTCLHYFYPEFTEHLARRCPAGVCNVRNEVNV